MKDYSLVLTLTPCVTLDLVRIPAGEFLMGSTDADKSASSDERPQHKVMLDDYLIGKYPVTNAQYEVYAKAKGLRWSMPRGKEKHPVVEVSWDDAMAFCAWASHVTGREVTLPTEAQWEKAARGTDGRHYPWGNHAPDKTRCNYQGDVGHTTVVGRYSPKGDSPYGVADMSGNVWEWVADWYDENSYANAPASNPHCPPAGTYRVVRGGGWYGYASNVRAAFRFRVQQTSRVDLCGFRVAVSAVDRLHADYPASITVLYCHQRVFSAWLPGRTHSSD